MTTWKEQYEKARLQDQTLDEHTFQVAWNLAQQSVTPGEQDAMDTLVAVLNTVGYTEEFAQSHPDMKVSEGVKLLMSQK